MWDNRIELLGWNIPQSVRRGVEGDGDDVLQDPGAGRWRVEVADALRRTAALQRRSRSDQRALPDITWQPGDFIVDTYTLTAGGGAFPPGPYELYIGFFTGTAPNWKNMTVSEAPGDMRDNADRVKIMTIQLD